LGTLRLKLSEYLSLNTTTSNDAIMNDSTNISIALSMPNNYNKNAVDAITTAVHQYFVNTAIADWFTITNKSDATDYIAQAADNLEALRKALNKRSRPAYTAPSNS